MKRLVAGALAIGVLTLATPLVAAADGSWQELGTDGGANQPAYDASGGQGAPSDYDAPPAGAPAMMLPRATGSWTALNTDGGANDPGFDASGGSWFPTEG